MRVRFPLFAALAGLTMTLAALSVQAEERAPGVLSISASGSATATPDMATITLGVVTTGKTAAAALTENSTRLALVFAELDAAGIEPRDRQTSGLSVQPEWVRSRNDDASTPPRIVGYTVSNMVTVRVRKLDDLGRVLDAVVRDGANSFHGLNFGVTDPAPLLDQARVAAVAEARRLAKIYADGLGVELDRVLNFSEQGNMRPMFRAEMAMAADSGVPVPVSEGEISFEVTVNVTWELDQ